MRGLRQFTAARHLDLGMQEVSGNLSHFHIFPHGKWLCSPHSHWWPSALPTEGPRIPPSPSQSSAEAAGHWRGHVGYFVGLPRDAPCAAPVEGIVPIYLTRWLTGNFCRNFCCSSLREQHADQREREKPQKSDELGWSPSPSSKGSRLQVSCFSEGSEKCF